MTNAASDRPRPSTRPQNPPAPLLAPTGSPGLDSAIDAINSTAAPFMSAPPPEQGAAGWVAQGLGGVLGVVGAPQQIIDQAFAGFTAPIAALFPAMPAITLLGMHVGMPHAHAHPPSLIPPAPPVPLPSIGMLVGSGAISVLGCGLPLARAGDIGISVTCGSLAPPFEVFTGSSNVFVGGARAARILDLTKHCNPTSMGPFAIAMGGAGVIAGAAGAIATGQAAAAAQAAADAAVLAIKLLCGKDPGIPPGMGALVGPPTPTVLIGGFPCPPIGDMVVGALMKGLKALANAAKKLRSSRRANAHCGNGSHPIYLVTGENFDRFTDFVSPGLFTWKRHYTTARAHVDGPLGFGFRHLHQRTLDVRLHQTTFVDWDGVAFEFPKFARGESLCRAHGYRLTRIHRDRYELATRGEPTMIFAGDMFAGPLPLIGLHSETRELAFEYDDRGRLTTCVDASREQARDRRIYDFQHDAAGRITAIVERGNPSIVRFAATYSPIGELVRVRDAAGGEWAYEYDAKHFWTRQIDPRNYAYSFRYDEQGRCVWASGQDGLWQAAVEYFPDDGYTRYSEGNEAVWEFHYDKDGFIGKIVNPQGAATIRERDGEGRILREIDPGGRELAWLYDADDAHYARRDRFGYLHPPELEQAKLGDPFARDLATTALGRNFGGAIEPDDAAMFGASGLLLDEIPSDLQDFAHTLFRRRGARTPVEPRVELDPLGRKLLEVDALGRTRRWQYDAAGNLIAQADRDGQVRAWTTTSWNLIGQRIDPLGHVTRHHWSTIEQMIALSDPLGNTTHWGYDKGERLTQVWRGDRLRDVYEYDLGDHFVGKYDGEGRLIFRNAEFHANHFVRRRELASGGEHRFDYDARGRIVEASTEAHEVRMAYDLHGRRAIDRRDGEGLERRHEQGGRERTRVLDRFEIVHERGRDQHRIVAPNGAVIRIRHTHEGVVVCELGNGTLDWQQYDHEGRLEARMTSKRDATGQRIAWGTRCVYSPEGDLLRESDSARGTTSFRVDAAHRLIEALTPSGERLAYEHDAAGNLVHKPGVSRLEVGPNNLALATAHELYEYDARDRLAARRHREGAVTRYHYDSFDMLTRVEVGGALWRAGYDAIGRRLWTQRGDRRREFWWDGDRLAAEQGPDGKLRIYVYAGHDALAPIAFVDYQSRDAAPEQGRLFHVFGNGIGMPLHIEDEHGTVVWWAQRIDPYGGVDVHPGSTIEYALRWPGHYYDADTGLHYNRYRYYDPGLGRYLQSDPIGYRGSEVNLYAYCANPLVQVDVLGLGHTGDTDGAPGSKKSTSGEVDGTDRPPHTDDADKPKLMSQEDAQRLALAEAEKYRLALDNAIKNGTPIDIGGGRTQKVNAEQGGPVVVVVVDRRTGEVSRAINDPGKQPPRKPHPALQPRLAWNKDNPRHSSRPSTHGEVHALNDALHKRGPGATEADISEMTVVPMWREGDSDRMRAGEPAPRCGNCEVGTDGAHAPFDPEPGTFDHKMRGQKQTDAAKNWQPGDRPWPPGGGSS
ncbi:RHS repeat-associated core domain-containing protein [Nannocystaceae bacterium ST9]